MLLFILREFTMAEIEHFVDPNDKSHKKFNQIKDIEIFIYSAQHQAQNKYPEKTKIGDAVQNVRT